MHHSNENSLTKYIPDTTVNVGSAERAISAAAGGGLIAYGLKQGGLFGGLLSLVGGGLLYRGATGHCNVYGAMDYSTADEKASRPTRLHVKKSLTINKSAAELYQFWRNFENLPKFMTHLESVKVQDGDGKRSHWVAKAPLGTTVEWDAELTSDVENERIGWNSLEGSEVPNSGVVEFRPTTNRGTEVVVTLTYEPPAGYVGSLIAKLFGEEPNQQVYGDLYRFKSLMESGEIITVEGQSSGREPEAKEASA